MAKYKVTGKYRNSNQNFPAIHTDNYMYAMGINLWRGTVWENIDGKWRVIKRVYS